MPTEPAHEQSAQPAQSAQSASQDPDNVRAVTDPEINARIDRDIDAAIAFYAGRPAHEIAGRIDELEREWDIERWLETNASILALGGLALGVLRHRAWLGLPVMVGSFLLQHAIRGWCPPIVLFRRWGVRTRREIDREKFSLMALRGDFTGLMSRAAAAPTLMPAAASVSAADAAGDAQRDPADDAARAITGASRAPLPPAAATALSGPA